jgi:ACS family pantothenate transporter-like MFS transporter
MGFTVMSVLSIGEFTMIFVIKYFVDKDRDSARAASAESEVGRNELDNEAQPVVQEKVATRGGAL